MYCISKILVYGTLHYTHDFLPWKKIGGETMNSCFHSNKNMMLGNVNVFKEHTVHSRKPCVSTKPWPMHPPPLSHARDLSRL